jgi:hypothetical protein
MPQIGHPEPKERAMQWLKDRRKLVVGILMVVTLIVAYSAKTTEPVKTFMVLTAVTSAVIVLEVAILRLLKRSK